MKNTIKAAAVIALSLFAAACAKVTTDEPSNEGRKLHFIVNTAENAVVKSFIESNLDGTYPQWSKDDKLAIFVGAIGENTKPTGVLSNVNEKGTLAKFDGIVTGIEGSGTFKSFTPASAFAISYNSGNVGITLAESQKPSSLTIDEACDILVAKEAGYTADADSKVTINDLFFKRMFSVVKVALKGPATLNGEKVQKFSLTAPEGTVLTGRAVINLSTATVEKWTISNNTVSATYSEDAPFFGGTELENEVWLVVNPGTIASGAKVTFAGETAGYTFSKEVTLSKDLIFPESQLAVINLTLADENCTKKATANNFVLHEAELVEGDYLVVYEGKAMKAEVASGRLAYADVKVSEKTIANSDASIVWHLSPSGDYWTILNEKINKYAASTGAKNKAQLLADGADDKSLWTVTKTKNAATFEFVNKANSSANPAVNANLRNNGTNGFACYSAATGGPLSLYRLGGQVDNTVPTLSVDQTSKTWAADATDAFVVKVTVNSEGGDWTVTPETLSWATVAVDKAAGTITVTPNGANETETANEATLTVTHTSDASLKKEITLKQNAAGGETPKTYTLTFASSYNDSNVGAYDKTWDATRDGFTWTMVNWNNNNNYNNNWTYVKAGPKGNTAAHAMITTKSTMPEAISKISITIDKVENGSITSIVLKSSTTDDFTSGTTIETKTSVQQGEVVFSIPSPQNGLFYQLDFTLNNTTSGKKAKNGVAQVSKVVYTNF